MKYVDLRVCCSSANLFSSSVTLWIVDDSWVLFVLTPAWFPLARTHSSILVLTSICGFSVEGQFRPLAVEDAFRR